MALTLPDFLQPASNRLYLHVGLQYYKPYRPTFQALRPSGQPPLVDGALSLEATGNFLTLHQALNQLDLNLLCYVAWFKLWESNQPLGHFRPADLTAVPFAPPELFWLGPPKRERRARRPNPGVGGPLALPAAEPPPALEGGLAPADPSSSSSSEAASAPSDGEGEEEDDEAGLHAQALGLQLLDLLQEIDGAPGSGSNSVPSRAEAPQQPQGQPGPSTIPGESAASGAAQAASSSTDQILEPAASSAPPPPPAAHDAADAPEEGDELQALPREAGLSACRFYSGAITFYPSKTTAGAGRFQANCGQPELHGRRCRLTRTCAAAVRRNGNQAQGRPLGLLAAWLQAGALLETAEEHAAAVGGLRREDRQAARLELLATENGPELAEHERPARPGEPDEPEGLA